MAVDRPLRGDLFLRPRWGGWQAGYDVMNDRRQLQRRRFWRLRQQKAVDAARRDRRKLEAAYAEATGEPVPE